ncbi:PVC-type heme-binding CxxCH protein [Aureliella helgolandensis]|uniref:Auracyanin-A n=1 Tax=Aureliella helgolandensis TaxID=2527968 RepID=A0A518G4K3_9BACT|nr:PVC-type heme-binding CxxCH protein [Aureliella helgolandensis]QDV23518.1 Auracyanin-A precursor [Aureliella helgolandensis]
MKTLQEFCTKSAVVLLLGLSTLGHSVLAQPLVFEGTEGVGQGKHIVFLAGDHEYRSEESLPALARILAKRHGFKCTVLFNIDPETGEIVAGNSNMPGMEALDSADLAVVFLRFQDFPLDQMKHFDAYLNRGGPVVGLRTSTHAFKLNDKSPFPKYSYDYKGADYELGFGHQVLGQTWVGHYGKNHVQSTRITLVEDKQNHPILRGVKDVWVQAGGYVGKPTDGELLTTAQPLNGMTPDSPADATKPPQPSEWTRSYTSPSGKTGRVFTSLYGTPEDILNDGYRRLLINGCFWALGLEESITSDANIAFVGPFNPNTFGNGSNVRGVKPEMYQGYESPIPASNNTQKPNRNKAEKSSAKEAPAPPAGTIATGKPARFLRIELPGKDRILTLAEVEVISGGKNIATEGKATQSSTHGNANAARAIDGNKHADFQKLGQTHTSNSGSRNPWWEIDLGQAWDIEKVGIWNRAGFEYRLQGFTITLLDSDRNVVFQARRIAAPQSLQINIKNGGKLSYLTYAGKAGSPASRGRGGRGSNNGRNQAEADNEPPLADVPANYRDPTPFAFQSEDVVAIVGNGLPDRMQHDGWLETLLQHALPGKQLRFRNLSASGDRPDSFPRSKGAASLTEYLQHVKADVVLAFFGYNESFAGIEKADEYRQKLIAFVEKTRGSKANGVSFPRIVLFSPIAHEDTHNPNVPDGQAHNLQLEAYTQATRVAAEQAGVGFVDLFHPSLELFRASNQPLTINGIHLTEEGNRQLAEVIATELVGEQVTASMAMEALRSAVLDKDNHWNNRYRARDGNDVWGGRSTLTFANDQSNATVLQHELSMLDVMTLNRDARVWAAANGQEWVVDDSNVPPPVEVVSNVGGGSKSSSAMKEGTLNYISGEEGIQHMAVAKGFEVSLFADESQFPELVNPVQMQFDTQGRLWAAVWPTYPKWEPLKEMNDALIILHDDNEDGKADRVTEFARVQNPLGFEFWNGGVIVTCAPEVLFLKDTDGDDIADVRTIMLQGLDSSDTHHGANNFVFGPDGGIYWQSGVFMMHNHEHPWGPSLQTEASAMYRFDPRSFTISMHANNSPNPHGISFDRWGYQYATDGTGGRAYQVRPEGDSFKMYELLKKEVRPVTANEVISSTHFPDSMQNDFLICNVIGFLGIKHYHLERNNDTGAVWGEPAGDELTVNTINADGTTTEEKSRGLLMSGDKNFRPSDAIFAPDGSLYFCDWHNAIIGHMQHNVRDPNRDHAHGRIYRLTAIDRPLQEPVAIDGQPITNLLENLKSPVDSIRHRTRVELSERNTAEVIAATKQWIQQFDPHDRADAHHLLEALWLHQQHNVKNYRLLEELLQSPEPQARIAAKTVKHFWFNIDSNMHGGVIAAEKLAAVEKSGILSDTPELTTIRVGTIPERMMYDVKELTVKPGKKVKLTFANPDFMPHNLLLVKPGTADSVGAQAIALGAGGFAVDYVPDSPDILWASKLVDHGQEQVIEFTAPTEEGAYPYICSFPGHHLLMRGMLYVTNDLEVFRAENPEPVAKITDWKISDFAEEFARVKEGRNFFQGKQLFTVLACAQCHQLGKPGIAADLSEVPGADHAMNHTNGPSLAVGPNLSDVVLKYKGDPQMVLREILEPSRNIEEKYLKFMFELEDDIYLSGNIVAEDDKTVTVQNGPTAAQAQRVFKSDIVSRRPSPISIMPTGIVNTLEMEQILDLLAYVLTDGNAEAPAFQPTP